MRVEGLAKDQTNKVQLKEVNQQLSETLCRYEKPVMLLSWPAGKWCSFVLFH